MSIKKLSLLFILFLSFLGLRAQEAKLKKEFEMAIGPRGGFGGKNIEIFESYPIDKQSLMFSIIVNVDRQGLVEDVRYTNKSSFQDSLISHDQLTSFLKADKLIICYNCGEGLI